MQMAVLDGESAARPVGTGDASDSDFTWASDSIGSRVLLFDGWELLISCSIFTVTNGGGSLTDIFEY